MSTAPDPQPTPYVDITKRAVVGEPVVPAPTVGDPVLTVHDVTLRFGGLTSLDHVSMSVARGSISAVIGPNGAGKTSLFNCLTGAYKPQEGQVQYHAGPGETVQLVGKKPYDINRIGLARTFQNIRLFPALSAVDNVMVGVESRQRKSGGYQPPRTTPLPKDAHGKAMELLDLVGLTGVANDQSSALSYGAQRRLEIARALGTTPAVLLLDEPAAGTNPAEKRELEALFRRVAATGVTVLLIEHDMRLVMSVAEHVTVLSFGKVLADGAPQAVQRDPAVIEAYLGAPTAHADPKDFAEHHDI